MLFKITYSIPVENVKACQARFMTGEEKMDGLTVTGSCLLYTSPSPRD